MFLWGNNWINIIILIEIPKNNYDISCESSPWAMILAMISAPWSVTSIMVMVRI